jgi:hypothetical protein
MYGANKGPRIRNGRILTTVHQETFSKMIDRWELNSLVIRLGRFAAEQIIKAQRGSSGIAILCP